MSLNPRRRIRSAARTGDGPWGAAIQYWLRHKHLRQAHIVAGTTLTANTVSCAANGLDVRTDTLRQIAAFFDVPLDAVLVSREWVSPVAAGQSAERVAGAASAQVLRAVVTALEQMYGVELSVKPATTPKPLPRKRR